MFRGTTIYIFLLLLRWLPVAGASADAPSDSVVVVTKLNFTYDGMDRPVLKEFDLDLPPGSR